MDMTSEFAVKLSFQGNTTLVHNVTTSTTGESLLQKSGLIFPQEESTGEFVVKILYKGKKVEQHEIVFSSIPKTVPKLLVVASSTHDIARVQERRSDPTIRGFDQEQSMKSARVITNADDFWGPGTSQDKNYKFCRLNACTWQSFGHRPTDETPHAFLAMQLLEKLSTDPGVVAIMKERELVVGTLAEMDPIDDRFMNKTQQQNPGICLLGYNTNAGMRIELKLRNDNLRGFRPYPLLVATLIHELSHNWVGEHNLLFWTNYGQMRVEYLYTHLRLRSFIHKGTTTAALAGLPSLLQQRPGGANVYEFVLKELEQAMAQYGLHPNSIASEIRQRCDELEATPKGQRLGGGANAIDSPSHRTARDLALEAAERRARERKDKGEG